MHMHTHMHTCTHAHRCTKWKVRASGNPVVDRVQEQLSYNDIYVSSKLERIAKENKKARNAFNAKLYSLITDVIFASVKDGCLGVSKYCINSRSKAGAIVRYRLCMPNGHATLLALRFAFSTCTCTAPLTTLFAHPGPHPSAQGSSKAPDPNA
jgi:hypothetical protein